VAAGDVGPGADPVCMEAPRDLEPALDSPRVNTVERCAGGGGPTRADAERDGIAARALAGVDAAGTDDVERPAAAAEVLPDSATETFAVALTGTLLFTKRCSLAS